MVPHVLTFGALLLVQVKMVTAVQLYPCMISIAHAPAPMVANPHLPMLDQIIIASLHNQGECQMVNFFVMIHSGVVNSEAMRARQGTNDEDTPIQLLELCVQ